MRVGWAGACTMLALLGAVLIAPLILDGVLSASIDRDRARGRIGVYERVSFSGEGASGAVVAGIVAPAGWFWVESRQSGEYLAADREASIAVEFHANTSDPEALLRDGVPVGAAAHPAETVPARSGLRVVALEYDLAAGDNPAVSITACRDAAQVGGRATEAALASTAPADCLLFRAAFGQRDEQARDRAQADLMRVLGSVEIVR